jgi:creatinine amidohydrolase
MMALLPEQVRTGKRVCEYPPALPAGSMLSTEGALPYAWLTHDLSRSGVIGDSTAATPAMGERLLASLADGWATLIDELHRFHNPASGHPARGSERSC